MKWIKTIIARFCGFSLIGAVSTILSVVIMAFLNEVLGCNGYASYVVAYVTTILFSYFANARLVYRRRVSLAECCGFFATYLSGMVVGTLLLALAKCMFPSTNDTLLGCAVLPFTVAWNFVFVNFMLTRRPDVHGAGDGINDKEVANVGQC